MNGTDLLNEEKIRQFLLPAVIIDPFSIEIFMELASTNQYLATKSDLQHKSICLAEYQSAGRGRRGKQWLSPMATNIYLSLAWFFSAEQSVDGLSLGIGIAVAKALHQFGVQAAKLKWPNDIIISGRKLAGILVEIERLNEQHWRMIAGVGINTNVPLEISEQIDQPWIDLHTIVGKPIERNQLAAAVINSVLQELQQFSEQGFAYFRQQWPKFDALIDQTIMVTQQQQIFYGKYLGINEHGGLILLDHNQQKRIFYSGDVSVRIQ